MSRSFGLIETYLPATHWRRLAEGAQRITRLALGVSTENVHTSHDPYAQMSDEELVQELMDVFQLSGLLAGDLKQSRMISRPAFKWRQTEPGIILCAVRGIFAILSRGAMLKSCWRSVVSMSITQRSGVGCRITALSWSSDCKGISSRPTSLGESTKLTSA